MVLRVAETCRAVQRRLHKVLWNGGCVLPVMCVYNILEKHNIPCSVVSGYYRPPVFWLQSQAKMDEGQQQWLPHLWVEVDGFDDPIIDISSVGGAVYEFCQIHKIEQNDQETFQKTAKALGCKEPGQIYRSIIVCNGTPTASRVLGSIWRPHKNSEMPEYCLTVPDGDHSIEAFGIPKHKLDEFAESPDWPNGAYFKNCSPGVKKLFTQVIEEPFEEEYDIVEFVEPVLKPAGQIVKTPNLIRFDNFMKENLQFLETVHTLPEQELLKHRHILDEYKRVSEALTPEDKMVMNMIAKQTKESEQDANKIQQQIEEEIKGKSPEELAQKAKSAMKAAMTPPSAGEKSETGEEQVEDEELKEELKQMKEKKKRAFRRDVR